MSKLKLIFGLRRYSLKESIEEVIEEHHEAGEKIDPEEKSMLRNVLSFSELNVEDVMTPRADIVYVNHDISLEELKKIIIEKELTRLPVCRKTLDNLAGFIHVKDVFLILCQSKPFNIDTITRQVLFVPPSMKVTSLLVKMQHSHIHMAIVIDEHGGTTGLVTMEDLVEEIVGEIKDEHDDMEESFITKLNNHLFEASARIKIKELEEKLEVNLIKEGEEEDFDTLGGLIFNITGRIPVIGEVITHRKTGLEFEITDADQRRIKRALIRKKLPAEITLAKED